MTMAKLSRFQSTTLHKDGSPLDLIIGLMLMKTIFAMQMT